MVRKPLQTQQALDANLPADLKSCMDDYNEITKINMNVRCSSGVTL